MALLEIALVVIVFVAGCNSSQPPPSGPPTTQASSLATSPTPIPFESVPPSASPQQAAVVAYRNMWAAYANATATADPDLPSLAQFSSGNALKLIVNAVTKIRSESQVGRGAPVIDPQVSAYAPPQEPNQITVSDCMDDSHWLLYKESGELADDVPGGRHRTTATVAKENNEAWKVSALTVEAVGTC